VPLKTPSVLVSMNDSRKTRLKNIQKEISKYTELEKELNEYNSLVEEELNLEQDLVNAELSYQRDFVKFSTDQNVSQQQLNDQKHNLISLETKLEKAKEQSAEKAAKIQELKNNLISLYNEFRTLIGEASTEADQKYDSVLKELLDEIKETELDPEGASIRYADLANETTPNYKFHWGLVLDDVSSEEADEYQSGKMLVDLLMEPVDHDITNADYVNPNNYAEKTIQQLREKYGIHKEF
jgi:hypothetical protein